MPLLPRTVIILGFVSLLNDAASEMITPLLPIFLTAALGAGPAIVGLVEGVAEATASVVKLISGWLADRGWNSKRLVLSGYALSNGVRPLIGLALGWPLLLMLRFADRIGKGLRTAPRDAIIAGAAAASLRGRSFGFHRSMDHAGAVIGPIAAWLLLTNGVPLARVFFWSVIPGACVLLLIVFGLPRDAPRAQATSPATLRWNVLHPQIKAMVIAAGGLALASVPEVFVVLWARDAGLKIEWVPLLWACASFAKMFTAWPAGALSDRFGRAKVLAIGWSMRIAILLLIATLDVRDLSVWLLFVLYSMSLAFTESAERSLIGDHASATERGTAFGYYHLTSGLLVLPGAVLFGLVWEQWSSSAAFIAAACVTAAAAATMYLLSRSTPVVEKLER
ncbi:MAG: MFS transporter [Steroidobacter sp.]